jgi:hypothetical protein
MHCSKFALAPQITRGFVALVVAAGMIAGVGSTAVRAETPGTPIPTSAVALDAQTIRVNWLNTADGPVFPTLEYTVNFNLRYRVQGTPDAFASYTYIGGGGPPDDRGIWANDPLSRRADKGPLSYDVSGLTGNTTYCFSLRSYALESPLVGSSYTALSPWSGEVCATTSTVPQPPAKPAAPHLEVHGTAILLTVTNTSSVPVWFEWQRQEKTGWVTFVSLADSPEIAPGASDTAQDTVSQAPGLTHIVAYRVCAQDRHGIEDWGDVTCSDPATAGGGAQIGPSVPPGALGGGQPGGSGFGLGAVLNTGGLTTLQTSPDLVAVNISGPQTLPDGVAQVYQAVVRNDGSATTGMELQINFSASLEAWGLPQPATAGGMNCSEKTTATGTAFACSGGSIEAGQTVTVQFQAHAARAGGGDISVVLNPNRSLTEADYNNDVASLHVTVP